MPPPGSSLSKTSVEMNPLTLGRGSSRGRQPALQGKAFSERSEDFSAAQRRESTGILGKSGIDFFRPSGIV